MAATELSITNDIAVANQFVKRSYLNDLTEYEVVPLAENQKKFQSIRLYHIDKLIFDKSENVNDKLVSVFNTVQNTRSALVMLLRGTVDGVELYLGVQSNREVSVADRVFSKSLLGNFPGSIATRVPQQELADLQRQILGVIWRYVKPGGYLIYSTCTINPAENDDNFRWIQENHPFHAVDIRPWLPETLRTESAAGGSLQLLPGVHDSDGFYLTALQRT